MLSLVTSFWGQNCIEENDDELTINLCQLKVITQNEDSSCPPSNLTQLVFLKSGTYTKYIIQKDIHNAPLL